MVNFIIKYWKNIAIVILAVALLFSWKSCKNNLDLKNSAIASLNDSTKHYRNKLGTITAEKNILEVSNKDFKKIVAQMGSNYEKLSSEFSRIKHMTVIKQEVRIDTVPVPFEVPVPFDFERKGNYDSEWLKFNYLTNQNGNTFSDFIIPNEQTVLNGFKRKWFLGRQTLKTDVTNTNPYIVTTDVQTIEVVVPKRFYDTRLFNMVLGAGLFYGAQKAFK